MLHHLHIENYAIIDKLTVDFSANLNIITGETGAGKSIVMGALSMVLGERANTTMLFNKDKKCIIEGLFKSQQLKIKTFLEDNDLDVQDEIFIRREILPNGKTRAFVNDTPVNLNLLQQLSSLLVDLHQQFDTLELNSNDFQREVLDTLANNAADLFHYQTIYKKYITAKQHLEELKQQQLSANKEFDFNTFLFTELAEADFADNELEHLNEELKMISSAESTKDTLTKIYFQLQEGEQPLVQQLKTVYNQLQSLPAFNDKLVSLADRLRSSQIELQDIADEVDRLNNTVSYDEKKINSINERLALGYRLLKKHGVTSTSALLAIKNDLESQVARVSDVAEAISKQEKEIHNYYEEVKKSADIISIKRQEQIKPFQEKVNKLLAQIGMPNASIRVQLQSLPLLNQYGMDAIEFLFDANKSGRFESLRKIASGGS